MSLRIRKWRVRRSKCPNRILRLPGPADADHQAELAVSPLEGDGRDEEDGDGHGDVLARVEHVREQHHVGVRSRVEAGPGEEYKVQWIPGTGSCNWYCIGTIPIPRYTFYY